MCFAARRGFYIKVLKDLENETARFSIDIKVLKDLKTMHSKKNARARRAKKNAGGKPIQATTRAHITKPNN